MSDAVAATEIMKLTWEGRDDGGVVVTFVFTPEATGRDIHRSLGEGLSEYAIIKILEARKSAAGGGGR